MPSAFMGSSYLPVQNIWINSLSDGVRVDVGGGGRGSRAKYLTIDEARQLALTLFAATEGADLKIKRKQ